MEPEAFRPEPIDLLAFVENNLEYAEPKGQQSQPNRVEAPGFASRIYGGSETSVFWDSLVVHVNAGAEVGTLLAIGPVNIPASPARPSEWFLFREAPSMRGRIDLSRRSSRKYASGES
jgi:hypothetical protein